MRSSAISTKIKSFWRLLNETLFNRLCLTHDLLVYNADSKAQITGKVEDKRKIGSLFTITVDGNVFVVSEERYKNIEIGDDIEL